jgi:hypothetical protein
MKTLIFIFLFLLFTACDLLRETAIGPCEHNILDPLIEIEDVFDESSGQAIQEFKITAAILDSNHIQLQTLLNEVSFNTVFYDSVLYCNTPCGFAAEEGKYQLTLSASGYNDTTVVIDARFGKFDGGCPSTNSGSTTVTCKMRKE